MTHTPIMEGGENIMFDFLMWLGGNLYERDDPNWVPGWMHSEVRDHDKTGCPGRNFVEGRWGGLVCTTCGK
jgi:hypothetical protein